MKRLFGILFLAIFSFNLLGYFVAFEVMKRAAKRDMKNKMRAGIDASLLSYFTFTEEEYETLEWKDKYEFVHKKVMYDLIRIEKSDGKIEITCVADSKETKITMSVEEQIDIYVTTNGKQASDKSSGLIQCISKLIVSHDFPVLHFPSEELNAVNNFVSVLYPQSSPAPPYSPPRLG